MGEGVFRNVLISVARCASLSAKLSKRVLMTVTPALLALSLRTRRLPREPRTRHERHLGHCARRESTPNSRSERESLDALRLRCDDWRRIHRSLPGLIDGNFCAIFRVMANLGELFSALVWFIGTESLQCAQICPQSSFRQRLSLPLGYQGH